MASQAVEQQYESSLQTQVSQLHPPQLGVDLAAQPAPPLPPPLQSAAQLADVSPVSQVPSPQVAAPLQPELCAQLPKVANLACAAELALV